MLEKQVVIKEYLSDIIHLCRRVLDKNSSTGTATCTVDESLLRTSRISGTSRKIISGISSNITVIAGTVMFANCKEIPPCTRHSSNCFCTITSRV